MNIQVRLRVEGRESASGILRIDDRKLEGLTEEETEQAVGILVSQWANERIELEWEEEEETGSGAQAET